jgi:hypothetical protein
MRLAKDEAEDEGDVITSSDELGIPERAVLSLFQPVDSAPKADWMPAKDIKAALLEAGTPWTAELRAMPARKATFAVVAALRRLGVKKEADPGSHSFLFAVQRMG